jgi:hypothetical protein
MFFKNLLINLLSLLLIALASGAIFMNPAEAVMQDFQWTGSRGYSVRGTFNYDETIATKIISEQGTGPTNNLKSLTVTFYNPSGKLIHYYKNVVDGKSQGNYFEFHFDPVTQQLLGNIDLGGERSGEVFFKGTINKKLSLIKIEPSGDEYILDSDR